MGSLASDVAVPDRGATGAALEIGGRLATGRAARRVGRTDARLLLATLLRVTQTSMNVYISQHKHIKDKRRDAREEPNSCNNSPTNSYPWNLHPRTHLLLGRPWPEQSPSGTTAAQIPSSAPGSSHFCSASTPAAGGGRTAAPASAGSAGPRRPRLPTPGTW